MIRFSVFALIVVVSVLSCSKTEKKSNKQIVGTINGENIYSSEIDILIQQEIFDQLNQIYNIRGKALDAYIDLKLLDIESHKYHLSTDEYVDKYVQNIIDNIGVDSLYVKYALDSQINIHGLNIAAVQKGSYDDKVNLRYRIKAGVTRDLIDSLRSNSNYEKYLYPPKSPNISMNRLLAYYRGNLKSNVEFYIISDFDCNKCIESHSLYDSIYVAYKDRVKFGYINFSATPTLAQLACNAANEQGKFWSYHDSLYNQKTFIDSTTVFTLAQHIGLDINKFTKDLFSPIAAKSINETIDKLVQNGIFATPTVIINKRLIYNSASFSEISYLIEQELKKE